MEITTIYTGGHSRALVSEGRMSAVPVRPKSPWGLITVPTTAPAGVFAGVDDARLGRTGDLSM